MACFLTMSNTKNDDAEKGYLASRRQSKNLFLRMKEKRSRERVGRDFG